MAVLARCPTCGGLAEAGTCASCGDESPASTLEQIRDQAADDRDKTAEDRDRAAELRDRGAADRDALARQHEQTTSDRGSAANLRDEATAAWVREDGSGNRREHIRRSAERDRAEAADDRVEAASDRAEALRSRIESAGAAQRALETLESMSDAFFTLDSEWQFTYLNPQIESILQRRREDLIGRNVWEEFPDFVGSLFDEEFRQAVAQQAPARFEEDYEPLGRTLEVRAYPVADGLAVYFTDVTNEHLRDARLRQTERLEMLGQLTAGVAHDFRNILGAVGGFAQLGQARAADETTTHCFEQIHSASEKGMALIHQLLAFGRQQELSPAAIDLNEVVGGLSSLLQQLVPAAVDLRLVPAPQPVPVFVDRSQLEQVLLNLVVNSREAIDTTGSITVSTTRTAPDGVTHEVNGPSGWLQVKDTGSGIPDDVRSHIFDPFFSTKAAETGTGLGLATIYGIVSQSGGTIFVDSTVDVGTTMTVALPAEQPHGLAAAAKR